MNNDQKILAGKKNLIQQISKINCKTFLVKLKLNSRFLL